MRLRCLFLALAFAPLAEAFAQPSEMPGALAFERREVLMTDTTAEAPATEPRPEEVRPAPLPAPTPLPLAVVSAAPHHVAYLEAFRILAGDNACSHFFGGARSLDALTMMTERMRARSYGDRTIAVRMRGDYTLYRNNTTGASYRLFDEVTVNSSGPLSRIPAVAKLNVGSFPAGTKRAWVLILLHELGHLVRTRDGGWLLPNDGDDPRLSDRNTRLVESRCAAQLGALRD